MVGVDRGEDKEGGGITAKVSGERGREVDGAAWWREPPADGGWGGGGGEVMVEDVDRDEDRDEDGGVVHS